MLHSPEYIMLTDSSCIFSFPRSLDLSQSKIEESNYLVGPTTNFLLTVRNWSNSLLGIRLSSSPLLTLVNADGRSLFLVHALG